MTPLQRLRQAGLLVYVESPEKLLVSPKPLLTEELFLLAKEHRPDILADLAEEEAQAKWLQRSRTSS